MATYASHDAHRRRSGFRPAGSGCEPAILRPAPGLAASPRVGYMLEVEGRGLPSRSSAVNGRAQCEAPARRVRRHRGPGDASRRPPGAAAERGALHHRRRSRLGPRRARRQSARGALRVRDRRGGSVRPRCRPQECSRARRAEPLWRHSTEQRRARGELGQSHVALPQASATGAVAAYATAPAARTTPPPNTVANRATRSVCGTAETSTTPPSSSHEGAPHRRRPLVASRIQLPA